MVKENTEDMFTNWYDLWTKQSELFFATAKENLQSLFDKGTVNPEEHLKQIQAWMETLKNQWQFSPLTNEQLNYQAYWKNMVKLLNDATDMMLAEWVKRSREKNPIQTVQELYELWINCCHELYEKNMRMHAYQEAYGEFMNQAFKLWKSYLPK